jgi:hypothetical protein
MTWCRYLYVPIPGGATSGDSSGGGPGGRGARAPAAVVRRYLLSENRTFDTLFHPQRSEIVTLVNAFTQGKGKWGIPGVPRKLGFLLHGPPGTGKTSFVRALAQVGVREPGVRGGGWE